MLENPAPGPPPERVEKRPVTMPENRHFMKRCVEFFATRFVLRENSLWRVLGLIKPQRRLVILANVLLTIASIIGSFVLVSLMPLFQFTLNPNNARGPLFASANAPAAPRTRYGEHLLRRQLAAERTTHTLTVTLPAENGRPARTMAIAVSHNDLQSTGTGALAAWISQPDGRTTRPLAAAIKRADANTTPTLAGGGDEEEDPGGDESSPIHKLKKSSFQKTLEKIPFLKWGTRKIEHEWNKLSGKYDATIAWGHRNPRTFVGYVCGFLFILLMLQGAIQFAGDSMLGKVGIDVTGQLLRDIYGNTLEQEMKFFDQTSTGTLINTCYREVFELRNIITFLASTPADAADPDVHAAAGACWPSAPSSRCCYAACCRW